MVAMSTVRGDVGISVQTSKFSALTVDSSSDDSEQQQDDSWTKVKPSSSTTKQKNKGHRGAFVSGDKQDKPLTKNAKKRARKKRQRNSESSDNKPAESALSGEALNWEQEVRMRNQAAADLDFQRDLEKALLMSKADAQDHAKALMESQLAERAALSESISLSQASSKSSGKKGVTLSLQEFHRGDASGNDLPSRVEIKSQITNIMSDDQLPITPTTPDQNFFSRLSEAVQMEVDREERTSRLSNEKQEVSAEDLPRIAHLKDDLEKRDAEIAKLRKHVNLLKKALREAKERNQSLCKILSQGEFSTKTQLIEQVEQLTTVKNELTEEVNSLSILLEQERSKNKALRLEMAKVMGGPGKLSRTGSSS